MLNSWLAQPPRRFSTARPDRSRGARSVSERVPSSECGRRGLGSPTVARLGALTQPSAGPRRGTARRARAPVSSRVRRGEGGGANAARARGSRWRERKSPPPTFPRKRGGCGARGDVRETAAAPASGRACSEGRPRRASRPSAPSPRPPRPQRNKRGGRAS